MAGIPKPTPLEAFDLNLQDADWLIQTARLLSNRRTRKPRSELRVAIGKALHFSAKDQELLDCIENDELFIVIKPVATIDRSHVTTLEPLLRQAVVAACAALEVFVADLVTERVGLLIRSSDPLPSRLGKITMSVDDWKAINDRYTRHRRGLRERVLVPAIKEASSTAPSQIGIVLAMIGVTGWEAKVDSIRQVRKGSTKAELEELTRRRNRIAHEGDRRGHSRAPITVSDADQMVRLVEGVCHAINELVNAN